eukprot:TRINITY_DN870_c0_g1_i1.p2 TRINITY_DN870_c0_g1~~TRINITY_DN870_c0_g1_i1.p2  ORF type:complete len:107 (-),score=50.47 TRINITY_DN870_c0_g1_i1:264-584(-)
MCIRDRVSTQSTWDQEKYFFKKIKINTNNKVKMGACHASQITDEKKMKNKAMFELQFKQIKKERRISTKKLRQEQQEFVDEFLNIFHDYQGTDFDIINETQSQQMA